MPIPEFAALVDGDLHAPSDAFITGFATDSREIAPGSLFLAIRGERVDGHEFVGSALGAGAVAALVERPVEAPHVLVPDLVEALARFGRTIRDRFDGPVIGITGSAGKTTTKEFVAAALSPLGPVLKTEGNRNTEYTSPLVWADLEPDTAAMVVEMAMRGFGQIAHLARIADPTIGLITNIGYAHLMQVGNREGIAKAKGELLEGLSDSGTAVLWHECDFLDELRRRAGKRQVWTFGFDASAHCRVQGVRFVDWSKCVVTGECFGHRWECEIPAIGRHVALDAAAAMLVASSLGVSIEEATEAISGAKLPPMRMEVVNVKDAVVLLDTYNASPPSMISAIETLSEMPVSGRRLAVLGEMKELGDYTEPGHRAVGAALKSHPLDEVVFVGEGMRFAHMEAPNVASDEGTIEDARRMVERLEPGDVLLIKGSRALELERVLDL